MHPARLQNYPGNKSNQSNISHYVEIHDSNTSKLLENKNNFLQLEISKSFYSFFPPGTCSTHRTRSRPFRKRFKRRKVFLPQISNSSDSSASEMCEIPERKYWGKIFINEIKKLPPGPKKIQSCKKADLTSVRKSKRSRKAKVFTDFISYTTDDSCFSP